MDSFHFLFRGITCGVLSFLPPVPRAGARAYPYPRLRPVGLIWGYEDVVPPGRAILPQLSELWRGNSPSCEEGVHEVQGSCIENGRSPCAGTTTQLSRGFRPSLRSRRNGGANQPLHYPRWYSAPFRGPSGPRNLLFSAASPVVFFRNFQKYGAVPKSHANSLNY